MTFNWEEMTVSLQHSLIPILLFLFIQHCHPNFLVGSSNIYVFTFELLVAIIKFYISSSSSAYFSFKIIAFVILHENKYIILGVMRPLATTQIEEEENKRKPNQHIQKE